MPGVDIIEQRRGKDIFYSGVARSKLKLTTGYLARNFYTRRSTLGDDSDGRRKQRATDYAETL